MNLKDLVFNPDHAVFLTEVENGDLCYILINDDTDDELLKFRVPKEDLLGATFPACDTPKVFMRWIRKALADKEALDVQIAQAKANAAAGLCQVCNVNPAPCNCVVAPA